MCLIAIGTWFIIGRKSEVGQTEGIQNGAAAAQQQRDNEKMAPDGNDFQPDEITPSVDRDHDGTTAAAAASEVAKVTIIVMKYRREILFCFMLKF